MHVRSGALGFARVRSAGLLQGLLRGVLRVFVAGFGFRVSGSGFRVSGFGFRVSGSGCRPRLRKAKGKKGKKRNLPE